MTRTCDHLAGHGLLARELGLLDPHLATCGTCQSELQRYRFIDDVPRLAALSPAPAGWERRVWRAIDALEASPPAVRTARALAVVRRWLAAVRGVRWLALPVAAAAAAALFLVLRPTPARPPLGLEVEVRSSAGGARRAVTAAVGDDITVRAPGADAVWVYREGGGLVVRCPDPVVGAWPGCRVSGHRIELTFSLAVAARHRVLVLSGVPTIPPTGDIDRDALTARARGAHVQLRSIAVPW